MSLSFKKGVLTLIGATTENPSFSVNAALLSRCRVVVLEKLTPVEVIFTPVFVATFTDFLRLLIFILD